MKRLIKYLTGIIVAGVAFFAMLSALGWLARPQIKTVEPTYDPAEIEAVEKLRDVSFDASDPSQLPSAIVQDVDYSEGEKAAWWPKGESPILAQLVKEGKLPPVEQRVGPEPVVMTGPDGIGKYGGTWLRLATSENDVDIIRWRLSYSSLVRWSTLGYPIVPQVAKRIDASEDKRVFTVHLRKGMRWSDGDPFDADDIMYWWNYEELSPTTGDGAAPDWMMTAGKPGKVEKIDQYTVRFSFEEPYGLFFEEMGANSYLICQMASHYLSKYHPDLGDPAFIQAEMEAFQLPTPNALYTYIKRFDNPEHPRLWPWVPRTYKPNSPYVYVRNPYYYAVDEQGNQLPYIDRVQFDIKSTQEMLGLAFSTGGASMQGRHVRFENYTELMSRREEFGTRILHWYPASRSAWAINPNLNRRVDPNDPDTKWKAQLLADKRFRQALSLAIDRKAIIRAEYSNQVRPSQVAPGKASPYHSEKLAQAYVEYDPERANQLLDELFEELGVNERDIEGMRKFPDGTTMTFYLDFSPFTGIGPAQFVVDDWAHVGVRTIARAQARKLFYTRKDAADFDFNIWSSESDHFALLEPRYFLANNTEAFYATKWARWYSNGGFYNDPRLAKIKNAEPPPKDHPMYEAYVWYEKALAATVLEDQVELFSHVLDIAAENIWTINIAEAPPQLIVVDEDMRNVPENAVYCARSRSPGNAGIEMYYFEHPIQTARAETRAAVEKITPRPRVTAGGEGVAEAAPTSTFGIGRIIRWSLIGIVAALLTMAAVRHPFVARRLVIMVPTLLIISLVVFTIIQLPPGDYLTSRIIQLSETGDDTALREIEDLKAVFHYEEPAWKLYCRWMGFYWFVPTRDAETGKLGWFQDSETGLLQGNMGRVMEDSQPVNNVIGDRIVLTVAISAGTILFTWIVAIPIGVYSAVKQYSIGDYIFTLIGFMGMSVPHFLLALVLMVSFNLEGLNSPEYAAQPYWDWPKFVDLLQHIWVPIVVMGITGTAGMIRIMRANLLDELRKPYVTTARAKGVRPVKLLFKYPVRVALNPFISGIGHLFPQLVSGGAIVAMVLSLPTVGPKLLSALFNEDMYLAGSLLMVLSLLAVFGTLVSDLLLLWLDPRIRYENTPA